MLLNVPQHQLRENMVAKDQAKMEVTLAYVMNSMFWSKFDTHEGPL